MLLREFPKWLVWLMNLAVIAILSALVYFLRWAGTEFCVGLIVGFLWCYIAFKCWRFDYDEPTDQPAPPHQQQLPRSTDRLEQR